MCLTPSAAESSRRVFISSPCLKPQVTWNAVTQLLTWSRHTRKTKKAWSKIGVCLCLVGSEGSAEASCSGSGPELSFRGEPLNALCEQDNVSAVMSSKSGCFVLVQGRKSCSTGRRAWLTDWLRTGRLSLWWGILSNKRFGCDNVRRLLARESWQGHMGELSTCHVKKSPSCVISWFCVQRGVMEKGGTGFPGGWAGWRDSFSDKWQCPENILLTEHWMHAPTFCRQIEQTRFHRLCWEKQTNKQTNKITSDTLFIILLSVLNSILQYWLELTARTYTFLLRSYLDFESSYCSKWRIKVQFPE